MPKLLISLENNKYCFRIVDSGKGFDLQETLRKNTGLGLRNIMSRIELLNGEMFLDSKIGEGTIYSIEIPTLITA